MVNGAVHQIEPLLHARVNAPVEIEYTSMAQIIQRLNNGEAMDVTVISRAATQQLAAKGLVKSQYDLVLAEVGIAVADNAPTPVLKTAEDFIAFLKATPSIAYFSPGASGNLLLQFAETNGLTDIVKQKATVISEGFTSTQVRDGKVASAIQQISELMAGGAKNIVPLPDSVQVRATTCVVVFNSTRQAEAAEQIAQVLTSSDAAAIYERSGLIPIFKH
jgi:molybdate transport system substrate-binding protein